MNKYSYNSLLFDSDDTPDKWDKGFLPKPKTSMINEEVGKALLSEPNNVTEILSEFDNFLVTSKSTRRNYKWNVKQFLVWCNQADYDIKRTTNTRELKGLIRAYDAALTNDVYRQNTIAIKLMAVEKFWEWKNEVKKEDEELFNLGVIFTSGVITGQDMNAFKKQVRISEDTYNCIIDYVAEKGTPSDKWIIFLLAFGCRRSEIVSVKISDIDTENKEINVYQPKTGDVKKFPLPNWYNDAYRFESGQVFIVTNESNRTKKVKGIKPCTPDYIYKRIKTWVNNIPEISHVRATPHSFRRYFVNYLQHKGHSDTNIAKLTGHRNIQMISKYGWDNNIKENPIIKNDHVVYDRKAQGRDAVSSSEEKPKNDGK